MTFEQCQDLAKYKFIPSNMNCGSKVLTITSINARLRVACGICPST